MNGQMAIEPNHCPCIAQTWRGSQMTKKIWSCDVIIQYKIVGLESSSFLKHEFKDIQVEKGMNPNTCYEIACKTLVNMFTTAPVEPQILGGSAKFNFEE